MIQFFHLKETSEGSENYEQTKYSVATCGTITRVLQHAALVMEWPDAQFCLGKFTARLHHAVIRKQGVTPDPVLVELVCCSL